MTDHSRMTDGRGRFPRGLLTSAPPPRELAEVRPLRATADTCKPVAGDPCWCAFNGLLHQMGTCPHQPREIRDAELARRESDKWTGPVERDLQRRAERAAYRQADFTPGPCYLPPDEPAPSPRWRWWRDPLVIGAAIGVAIIVGLFFAVVP